MLCPCDVTSRVHFVRVISCVVKSACDVVSQCLLKGLPDLVELYLAGNPFTLEGGERPTYHVDIQTVLPLLEIIDGVSDADTSTLKK